MEIKISEIPEEGLLRDDEEDASVWDMTELVLEGTVGIHLRALRQHDDEVYLHGKISARVVCECGRCLCRFSHPIQSEVHIQYLPLARFQNAMERENMQRDIDVIFYTGEVIHLNEIILEQLIMSIPIRPLCADNCKGLCPCCGEDRNKIECSCKNEPVDFRLAPLANYFHTKEIRRDHGTSKA